MSLLDVFRQDAFSAVSMTAWIERNPYNPTGIGELGIFEPQPVSTTSIAVYEEDGALRVIPTSPRGAPVTERTTQQRKARRFDIPRHACGDTIWAHELQNVVEFRDPITGETVPVLKQMQAEVAKRTSGPTGLQASMEMTWERLRVGAIHGIVKDANDSVIYNWFTEFNVSAPAEVAFDLSNATPTRLRVKCAEIVRGMARAAKGAFTNSTRVYAACSDAFWDAFIVHPEVEKTFLNQQAAAELRRGTAWETIEFGGITWFNYRGTDDNSTVAIDANKVRFFPVGAPGVFKTAFAPHASFGFMNTPGRPLYAVPIFDLQRDEWWRQELYSYPLFMCTRPEVLFSGRAGS